MSCAAALPQLDRGSDYESERHRFESYTPHQLNLKPPATGAFLLRRHCMDSNLGRGAGVEKTRSVLARGRARRQAGEAGADPRSGCAESYTPHQSNLKPPATEAFLLRRYPMDSNLGRGKNSLIITSKNFFKLSLDPSGARVHNNSCVAALPQLDRGSDYESERHRFESYTPHQLIFKLPETGAFLIWEHCGDSNLGRGASAKKTRSVFSERASTPAGGRSRRGSAQRMRGILYAAPIDL